MKKYKIFDKKKFDWAMDSALDALYREDKNIFMKRVTDIGAGLIFSALMVYEKYDKDELLQVRDQILSEINYGIKDDDNV